MTPMPGKIVKVFKTAGDVIKKGDPIMIMEAMKMEVNDHLVSGHVLPIVHWLSFCPLSHYFMVAIYMYRDWLL